MFFFEGLLALASYIEYSVGFIRQKVLELKVIFIRGGKKNQWWLIQLVKTMAKSNHKEDVVNSKNSLIRQFFVFCVTSIPGSVPKKLWVNSDRKSVV